MSKRNDKAHASSGCDHPYESWGGIRPHLRHGRGMRRSRETHGEKRISMRESIDSTRSSRKRASIYNSLSSKESGRSVRRPADLALPASTNWKNAHIRHLPPCVRQTFPMAKDHPLRLKYDPEMLPESTTPRDDMDKVDDVLIQMQSEKAVMWKSTIPS